MEFNMGTSQNHIEMNMKYGVTRSRVKPRYRTRRGVMYHGDCENVLKSYPVTRRRGKVQLILTSPPFPLNRKKKYGNLTGEEYLKWLKNLAPLFRDYLTSDGSIVIELGNAWEAGKPIMSTLPLKSLMAFMEAAELNLCQEFICYNPARLPTPAQWVTVERIRVKDAFTRIWWMSPVERPKANNRNVLSEYSKSMQELINRAMHLTLVDTTCSIMVLWKIIQGLLWSLKAVSQVRKLAVNILPSCVGRVASGVLDATMIRPGIWNEVFIGVPSAATKFPLPQELFFKTAGNR